MQDLRHTQDSDAYATGHQSGYDSDTPEYIDGSTEAPDSLAHEITRTSIFWKTYARNISSPIVKWSAGFFLHFLVICIHFILMVIVYRKIEQRVAFRLGHGTDRLSVILPVATQVVWTSYLALMLVITQDLALRKIFTTTRLLTTTHNLSAWSGVGAAFLGLLRQFSLPASFVSVLYVALYLVAAQVLHITSPSLVTLAATNITVTSNVNVINGLPSFNDSFQTSGPVNQGSTGILALIGRSQFIETPGLDKNVLYDIPDQDNVTGFVDVKLTVVDVQCGSMPVKQVGRKSNTSWTINGTYWRFHVKFDEDSDVQLPKSLSMASRSDRVLIGGANMLFWSFVNITDESNTNASYVPLSPAYRIRKEFVGPIGTFFQGVQVIGCTISTSQQDSVLNADVKQLISHPNRRNSSTWKSWDPAPIVGDKLGLDELLVTFMGIVNGFETAITDFLAARSGLFLRVEDAVVNANGDQPTLVKLRNFENGLADAIAAVLWSAARIAGVDSDEFVPFRLTRGSASTTQSVQALRLNINKVPLVAGFCASCILFVLFWILTPIKSCSGDVVTGGMLQTIWLFADSEAQKRVAEVSEENASLDNLRKAGMFKVLASGAADVDVTVRRRAVIEGDDSYERVGTKEMA